MPRSAIREHEQGDDPLALLGWLYQFSIPEDVRGENEVGALLLGLAWLGALTAAATLVFQRRTGARRR